MNKVVAVRYGENKYTPAVLSTHDGVGALIRFGIPVRYAGEGGMLSGKHGGKHFSMKVHLVSLPAGGIMCYPKKQNTYRFAVRRRTI